MACSHRRCGRDKTVLSGPHLQCEYNWRPDKTVLSAFVFTPSMRQDKTVLLRLQLCLHRRRGQDKTVLYCPRRWCKHNCRQDKTVLSCPCRWCEQAISCKLETGLRQDKTVLSAVWTSHYSHVLCEKAKLMKTVFTTLSPAFCIICHKETLNGSASAGVRCRCL